MPKREDHEVHKDMGGIGGGSLPDYMSDCGEEVRPIQNKDYVNSSFISIHVFKVKNFFKPRQNYKPKYVLTFALIQPFVSLHSRT